MNLYCSKNFKLILITVLFALFISSIANAEPLESLGIKFPPEPEAFDASKVSCVDVATFELWEKSKFWRNHPQGDLFFMANSEEILRNEKMAAQMGSPNGMYYYGAALRMIIGIKVNYYEESEPGYLSEEYMNYIIEVLTYINMAATQNHEDAIDFLKRTDRIGSRKIPESWLQKAKSNVENWKDYCNNESNSETGEVIQK